MSPSPSADAPRISCSTASIFTRPLREILSLVSEAGFSGVEIMVTKDPATQDPALLHELTEERGLRIDAIHAPFLLMTRSVWGTDPVGKIYRAIELAQEIEAPLVVVHPPYRWQTAYRKWLDEQLPGLERTTGVRVGVENMFPLRVRGRKVATFHAGQTLTDLEGFPDIVLDTSHAAVARLDLLDAFRRLAPRLAHVHLSNNAGKGWDSHLPVDEGVLPLDRFLDALAADGYRGSVALELDLRRVLPDREAVAAVLQRNLAFCESRLSFPTT